jgi:hypothetical protein
MTPTRAFDFFHFLLRVPKRVIALEKQKETQNIIIYAKKNQSLKT